MIALIDNYDSFSYNLYQLLGELDPDIRVFRNDAVTVEGLRELAPNRIVISPGPGRPEDAGISMEVPIALGAEIPVLGVCLGHQAICAAFGATVAYARRLMHGKRSLTTVDTGSVLFRGLPAELTVGRYHSLAVEEPTLPRELAVTARADDGEVMAVEHRELPIYGVQFHPESILTPHGQAMLGNFLSESAAKGAKR